MRVVITGADGFAGRHLCRALLAQGAAVYAWTRTPSEAPIEGVRYRTQDVRDAHGCRHAMLADNPDRVFHLAAVTSLALAEAHPKTAKDVNVLGTRNVFSAMPLEARGVFASTCHVYGRPQSLPMDEAHRLEPVGAYAQTKMLAEQAAKAAHPHVVIARAFHHTGPGQDTLYALADWAQQMSRGAKSIQVGDLSLRRDYSDVRDICAGYALLAETGTSHQAYNLCSGVAPRLLDMFNGLRSDRSCQPSEDPTRLRADEVLEVRGDNRKAMSLGWRPSFPLSRTLKELSLLSHP